VISLVTGGAGFVGSHLVDALLRRGDEVVILDNLSTGSLGNIEAATKSGKATFVFVDVVQSAQALRAVLDDALAGKRIDRLFHLASPASPEAYGAHPWETLAVNAVGTMSLVDIALEHGARFLYASTSEIYGDPLEHPQAESYFGNVDPIGERACYDEGKRFGEATVSVAIRARGLDGRIVRFFNCYGPRMSAADGRLIPALAEAAADRRAFPIHGTGLQTRSMTYIDDAVRLVLLVMEQPQTRLQPVNVGNDEERTIIEIARAFARVAGVPYEAEHVAPRPGDPQRRKPDLTIARSLGWQPKVSLDDGQQTTIAWLQAVLPAFI